MSCQNIIKKKVIPEVTREIQASFLLLEINNSYQNCTCIYNHKVKPCENIVRKGEKIDN